MGMGLLSEGITEVIAVTKDNAAPIGIIVRPGQGPKMILFKGSRTEENIRQFGWVTANFVSDCFLYPKYAFSDVMPEELTAVYAGGISMQRLVCADAWMGFRAVVVHETELTYLVDLIPQASEYLRIDLRPVNRGFDAVVDAAVHATRYVRTHDPELLQMIEYDLGLIRKCGGRQEHESGELIAEICGISEK